MDSELILVSPESDIVVECEAFVSQKHLLVESEKLIAFTEQEFLMWKSTIQEK